MQLTVGALELADRLATQPADYLNSYKLGVLLSIVKMHINQPDDKEIAQQLDDTVAAIEWDDSRRRTGGEPF